MNNKSFHNVGIFDSRYIEVQSLYLSTFGHLPSVHFLGSVNGEKAYEVFLSQYGHLVQSTLVYRWFNRRKKKYNFDRTVLVLHNEIILEFDEDYVDILHNGREPELLLLITEMAGRFRERTPHFKAEVSLVVRSSRGLELKAMEIKRTRLDIGLYYEDDFRAVDEMIRKRLGKKDDKGIVLLHGLPGTGKTTYLRYLIGRLKKRVLFLSADVARGIMDPSFVQILIDNPNSVIIIEDAEHLIMDRRSNLSSSVSDLLNISDGLLADFLNVQLICTFNNALTLVDSALMRKGRLIAQYNFGKLSVARAQRLSDHLKMDKIIDRPMTLAEIAHPEGPDPVEEVTQQIGFRRQAAIIN